MTMTQNDRISASSSLFFSHLVISHFDTLESWFPDLLHFLLMTND